MLSRLSCSKVGVVSVIGCLPGSGIGLEPVATSAPAGPASYCANGVLNGASGRGALMALAAVFGPRLSSKAAKAACEQKAGAARRARRESERRKINRMPACKPESARKLQSSWELHAAQKPQPLAASTGPARLARNQASGPRSRTASTTG